MVDGGTGEVQGTVRVAGVSYPNEQLLGSPRDTTALSVDATDSRQRDLPLSGSPRLRRGIGQGEPAVRSGDGFATREAVGVAENVFGGNGAARNFFVAPSYRAGQRESIDAIEDAFEQGYRYVVLEAPTGSGKSHIARAFAFQAGTAHILTSQKGLQDQYERDFPDMFVMKGRSAYTSIYSSPEEHMTCANCLCQKDKKYKTDECPYTKAKRAAKNSKVVVHNFDSFYYQTKFSPKSSFAGRNILIVDEAHNIEGKYLEFMSFSISNRSQNLTIPRYGTVEEYESFLRSEYRRTVQMLDFLEELEGGMNDSQLQDMHDKRKLVSSLRNCLDNFGQIEYVVDYKDKRQYQMVTFRPVQVGGFVRKNLFPFGNRVLMMSATILDKDIFCWNIGLDPEEVAFIRQPSHFPKENRKILFKPVGSMSFKKKAFTLPQMMVMIEDILDRFPNTRGIIQTHAEWLAEAIRDELGHLPRLTFNKDFRNVTEMLEEHDQKSASVIVASGLREGIDLYGDRSRLQIFCKVPYPSLGDVRVKRKMELSPAWYGYTTAYNLVQALGRSVRSETDKAVTYILDEDFRNFYARNKRFLPDYIREAIV